MEALALEKCLTKIFLKQTKIYKKIMQKTKTMGTHREAQKAKKILGAALCD